MGTCAEMFTSKFCNKYCVVLQNPTHLRNKRQIINSAKMLFHAQKVEPYLYLGPSEIRQVQLI